MINVQIPYLPSLPPWLARAIQEENWVRAAEGKEREEKNGQREELGGKRGEKWWNCLLYPSSSSSSSLIIVLSPSFSDGQKISSYVSPLRMGSFFSFYIRRTQ